MGGKNVQVLAVDLPNFKGGMLDWCKCAYINKEETKIEYLCCRQVSTKQNLFIKKLESVAKCFLFVYVQGPLNCNKNNE